MCVGTRCVPSVATRVVAKIYRPLPPNLSPPRFFVKLKLINKAVYWLLRVLSWTSSISISPGAAPHATRTADGDAHLGVPRRPPGLPVTGTAGPRTNSAGPRARAEGRPIWPFLYERPYLCHFHDLISPSPHRLLPCQPLFTMLLFMPARSHVSVPSEAAPAVEGRRQRGEVHRGQVLQPALGQVLPIN